MHLRANREYRQNLEVLPKRAGYANSITDGWNRQLV
jgi:hypothetical protein